MMLVVQQLNATPGGGNGTKHEGNASCERVQRVRYIREAAPARVIHHSRKIFSRKIPSLTDPEEIPKPGYSKYVPPSPSPAISVSSCLILSGVY